MDIRAHEFSNFMIDIFASHRRELEAQRIKYELEITIARDQRDEAMSALFALRDSIASKEENDGTS